LKRERHGHQASSRVLGSELDGVWTLSGVFVDRRLGIEEVGLERPTVHKELNHPLGSGRFVRAPIRALTRTQDAGHAQGGQAASGGGEPVPAGKSGREGRRRCHRLVLSKKFVWTEVHTTVCQSTNANSLLPRRAWQYCFQSESSAPPSAGAEDRYSRASC